MDERELRKAQTDREIRGHILRLLTMGDRNTLLVKQIANILVSQGLIIFHDAIDKYLDYLSEAGLIVFTNKRINAYNVYRMDDVIKLTNKGINMLRGEIEKDPGVDA
jgi:hypothetical protein